MPTDWLASLSGTSGRSAETDRAQQLANQKTEDALAEQTAAKTRAVNAAVPGLDKESTRVAGDEQMRKLLQAAGFRFAGAPTGPAPLGTSTLYGSN